MTVNDKLASVSSTSQQVKAAGPWRPFSGCSFSPPSDQKQLGELHSAAEQRITGYQHTQGGLRDGSGGSGRLRDGSPQSISRVMPRHDCHSRDVVPHFVAFVNRWFNFRMTGVADVPLTLHIINAGSCSFPDAWPGYQACASYDLEHWFR
jgi:hypothetical protein